MPTTYAPCGPDEYALLTALIDEHRGDLKAVGATITLLFAYGDDGKPAMKKKNQRILGMAKINNLKDRVEGKGDATITLDGDWWHDKTNRRRLALLHHELSHIGTDDDQKHDDIDRPILKSIPGDWENDGFYAVARIYGDDAPEVAYLKGVQAGIAQRGLPFGEEERSEEQDSATTNPGVIRDTFTALLSVGHTESRARAAIDEILSESKSKTFASVNDLIDAIYQRSDAVFEGARP